MTPEDLLRHERDRLLVEVEFLKMKVEQLRKSHNKSKHRLVLIESPYAGDIDRNVAYARAAMRDCLTHGEAPYASHLLYTQPGVLDDSVLGERNIGIEAGLAWGSCADATAVYADLGITDGMKYGIEKADRLGRRVEHRALPGWSKTR